MRSDNTTNLAYVGQGDGSTAPEQYIAYHPGNTGSTVPIYPGQTAILRNLQTGLFCHLMPVPAGYPLAVPALPRRSMAARPPQGGKQAPAVSTKAAPASCATFGLACDQPTAATGTVLTYDEFGMRYQGAPLVQSPGTATLILSNATECRAPGGNQMTFVPAAAQPPRPPPPPPVLAVTGVQQQLTAVGGHGASVAAVAFDRHCACCPCLAPLCMLPLPSTMATTSRCATATCSTCTLPTRTQACNQTLPCLDT